MANRTVSLMIRIRTSDGKRPFVNPAFAANRRIRPLYADVNGNVERHPEGSYYLRYAEGPKRIWEPVGSDPHAALAAKLRREHILESRTLGVEVVDERACNRILIADAMQKFLLRVRVHRSHKTQNEYDFMLPQFASVCGRTYIDEITTEDMLLFIQKLRELRLADRTIANRTGRVCCFLKAFGVTGLLLPNDRPRYDEKVVEAYTLEQIRTLLAHGCEEDNILFRFFLGTGCREAEVAHATWRDVNSSDKTFTVHSKRKQGFGPKDREERVIPIPDSLVLELKARKQFYQDSLYLFPNRDGRPNGHMLRKLKKLALRSGLNCGECINRNGLSCKKHAVCERWELHKFRKTFATMHHESGVSARTLQSWLGHSDLETTLAYLKIADMRSERTREQVNNTFAVLR